MYFMTGLRCAVSGKVIHGLEAMDTATLASLVGRALKASVLLPYTRAKARAEVEAERARMKEQSRRGREEKLQKMEEEK